MRVLDGKREMHSWGSCVGCSLVLGNNVLLARDRGKSLASHVLRNYSHGHLVLLNYWDSSKCNSHSLQLQ